jgi:hypothetical protein
MLDNESKTMRSIGTAGPLLPPAIQIFKNRVDAVQHGPQKETSKNALSDKEKKPPLVKGCFIATAAMGSPLHPHVQLLRDFRDNILLKSRYKQTFENLLDKYYIFSPPIARKMDKHIALKFILRYALVYPVVFGIKCMLPLVNILLGIERDVKQQSDKMPGKEILKARM